MRRRAVTLPAPPAIWTHQPSSVPVRCSALARWKWMARLAPPARGRTAAGAAAAAGAQWAACSGLRSARQRWRRVSLDFYGILSWYRLALWHFSRFSSFWQAVECRLITCCEAVASLSVFVSDFCAGARSPEFVVRRMGELCVDVYFSYESLHRPSNW